MAGTIQQIARLAGVSRGTVDRALNHRGRIRPEVAARIEEVAAQLDYVPMSLRKNREQASRTRTAAASPAKRIGVITQLCRSSFMINVNQGIRDISALLSRQGIEVLVRESATVDEKEQLAALDELESLGIDALAIMPVDNEQVRERLNRLITERQLPVATFNSDIAGVKRMCFVGLNNWKSGQTAAGLMGLMTRGTGKILGITGYFSNRAASQRIDGFMDELKRSFPGMELIGVQGSFDRADEVEKIITGALTVYPELAGILVASGGQEGVKRAFEKLQPARRPYVIIYDLTPKNEAYLQEGIVDFLIDQEGYLQGYRAISLLADKLQWKKEPANETMYTEIRIKTKYNLS